MSLEFYSNYFKSLWRNEKPIAKLFKSDGNNYLYDTGTNKIFTCEEVEYTLLKGFLDSGIAPSIDLSVKQFGRKKTLAAAQKIKREVEKENILLAQEAKSLTNYYQCFEEYVNSHLWILTLELTERCNLRCGYCIYNPFYSDKRNHGYKDMDFAIAKLSVDYLKNHSTNRENVSVVFYGGEPLLRYDLIKTIVGYVRSTFINKNVGFSITTNATLINSEIAKFFFRNGFSVTVSIDGPKDVHDAWRKTEHNKGSHDRTMNGLRHLKQYFSDQFDANILLSMVYAPPYTEHKMNRLADLWNENDILSKETRAQITYPSYGSIPKEALRSSSHTEKDLQTWAIERYLNQYQGKREKHALVESIIEKELALIFKRPIYNKPIANYRLNGCCIPGSRRLFVSTKGRFHICERLPTSAPIIGSVFSGIDMDTLRKTYIEEYESVSLPQCSMCWAIRLCSACYVHAFKDGKFDKELKKKACLSMLSTKERFLSLFCRLQEISPEGLNHLASYKLQ